MLSKLTAFLQQAAEVTSQVVSELLMDLCMVSFNKKSCQLAPQPSRHEEFQSHWKAITNTLTEDNGIPYFQYLAGYFQDVLVQTLTAQWSQQGLLATLTTWWNYFVLKRKKGILLIQAPWSAHTHKHNMLLLTVVTVIHVRTTQGPCMEYLLRHKLLNALITTAQDDVRCIYYMVPQNYIFTFHTVSIRDGLSGASLLYPVAG